MIIYMRGDKGKPSLIPLFARKDPNGCPLTKGDIQGLKIHAEIQLISLIQKPNFLRT
jgi:hypothetical protein